MTRYNRLSVLALYGILTPVGARSARAQAVVHEPVDSGTVIRMHRIGVAPTVGKLTARLAPGDATLQYCRYPGLACTSAADTTRLRSATLASLSHLERKAGSRAGIGAIIGGIVGAIPGAWLGAALGETCEAGCGGPTRAGIAGAFILGLTGAGLGALIGTGFTRWESVP